MEYLGSVATDHGAERLGVPSLAGLDSLVEPDAPFTPGEAEQWKAKLDDAVERIEKLHEEHQVGRHELYRLRSELDRLKGELTSLPKRTVRRSAGARIFEYLDRKFDMATKATIDAVVRQTLGSGGG